MAKIIEPSEEFAKGFLSFCKRRYKGKEFSIAEAANAYFQKRYGTDDKWTDPKNITGYVKRKSEAKDTFQFVGRKPSRATGKMSKHYKVV